MYYNALKAVIKREFIRIAEKKTIYGILIFMPLILSVTFGLIYQKNLVREIPVAILNEDKSSIATIIIKYIESTSSMKIVEHAGSIEEIKSLFRQGKIDGAFYFPKDMEKDIKSNRPATVSILINSSNLIKNNYILSDGSKIIRIVSGGIILKKLKSAGLTDKQAMSVINPIRIESQILYNPNYSYSDFLIPSLACFGLLMSVLLVSVLLISSESTHNTYNELIEMAEGKASVVLLGKSLPHIALTILNSIITFGIFIGIFGININGSIFLSLLFLIFFLIVTLFLGLMISSLFKDQMFATELALFFVTPAFIFSGLTYPLWAMPEIHILFAQVIPYTHFISGFLKISMMNAPLQFITKETLVLLFFLFITIVVSYTAIRFQIRKHSSATKPFVSEEK